MVTGAPTQLFALTSDGLAAGDWPPLITYLFVHGGWVHVLMNSIFILAFGAPVARFSGLGPRGALTFLAFFLMCGVVAALGYAGWLRALASIRHTSTGWALVGASGAAAGLMGAAARLIDGRGRLGPLTGRTVIAMTGPWVVANALLGVSGLTPGAAGVPVAWEAHIIGYFAGLLLAGPMGWLAGIHPDHSIAA